MTLNGVVLKTFTQTLKKHTQNYCIHIELTLVCNEIATRKSVSCFFSISKF